MVVVTAGLMILSTKSKGRPVAKRLRPKKRKIKIEAAVQIYDLSKMQPFGYLCFCSCFFSIQAILCHLPERNGNQNDLLFSLFLLPPGRLKAPLGSLEQENYVSYTIFTSGRAGFQATFNKHQTRT